MLEEKLELLKKEQPRKYYKVSKYKNLYKRIRQEDKEMFERRIEITKIYIEAGFTFETSLLKALEIMEYANKCKYL